MRANNPVDKLFILGLGLLLSVSALPARADVSGEPGFVGEELYYQVSYSGLFSAFSRIAVADARLSTRLYQATGQTAPLLDTALTVSTAAYEFVEGLYPFRYRMRTLYQLSPQGSVAFERIKRTRKTKYDLVWVDREPGMQRASIRRYRGGKTPVDAILPASIAHWADASAVSVHKKAKKKDGDNTATAGVLDWLSLLQAIRGLPELPSEELLLPVTDGNGQRDYRVVREGRESLDIDGQSRSAWKYRFAQVAEEDEDQPRPIRVWLSDDGRHLPLRLQTSHTVGRFIIEYRGQPAARPISIDTPIQVAEREDDY